MQTAENSEPNIIPAIETLAFRNLKKETVSERIVAFFRAFDDYKED